MPRKNIYIRKEDEHILEKAREKIGEDKALGALLMEALEEKLENLPEVQERTLRLQLLKQLGVPAFNDAINYDLINVSEAVKLEAEKKANLAYIADPDHFTSPLSDQKLEESEFNYDSSDERKTFGAWQDEILTEFAWNSIEYLINYDDSDLHPLNYWFRKAKWLINKGAEKVKNMENEDKVDLDSTMDDE